MLHENSKLSYKAHKETGRMNGWRERVFDAFLRNGKMTDRDVMQLYQVTDANLVRPEISRMVQEGLLTEVGKIRCEKTHRLVRLTMCSGMKYHRRGELE